MISITKANHGFLCQNCLGKEEVKEIDIHRDGVGTIVRLCENCREELADKLIECDRKKTERERWEQEQKEDEEICKSCTKVDCSGCGICSDRKDGSYQ